MDGIEVRWRIWLRCLSRAIDAANVAAGVHACRSRWGFSFRMAPTAIAATAAAMRPSTMRSSRASVIRGALAIRVATHGRALMEAEIDAVRCGAVRCDAQSGVAVA